MDIIYHVRALKHAETQFRFAIALNTLYSGADDDLPTLIYFDKWYWGKHKVTKKELHLSRNDERNGAMFLSHSALYILVVQIDTALEALLGKGRFNHQNNEIRSVACISRLIRNAFAHNPFYPTWLIDRKMKNKKYRVERVGIEIDTTGLENVYVKRKHYGGPLAVLELSKFVRALLRGKHQELLQ